MNIEWVNVADTAVKIGLGGIISGLFTYVGLRYSHKSQMSKYIFEHKIKLVEQITADIDEYFNGLSSFTAQIAGIAKARNIKKNENSPLADLQWKSIMDADKILTLSWPKQSYATAKLRLLKANDVVIKLNEVNSIEKELRNKILFNKEMCKFDEMENYSEKIMIVKSELYNALSDFYDSLLK